MHQPLDIPVRPTVRLLESLGISLPPLSVELHAIDIPLVAKAQRIPKLVDTKQAERIKVLAKRHWYKVKVDDSRGGVTRLRDDDTFVVDNRLDPEDRWWLCICGTRASDSPQRDFYKQVDDATAENSLPKSIDIKRYTAEISHFIVVEIRERVRKSAYRSLTRGVQTKLELPDLPIALKIRAFPDHTTYISVATRPPISVDDYLTVLSAFAGVSPQDWMPENECPVNIFENTTEFVVYSAMLPAETQAALLEEGDANGW